MNNFLNAKQIRDDIISKLLDEDIEAIKTLKRDEMIRFHHTVGQFIRNEYGLWKDDNPLTSLWVIDSAAGNTEYIDKDDVDCHPCHPDEVSHQILLSVWDEIQCIDKQNLTHEDIENERLRKI